MVKKIVGNFIVRLFAIGLIMLGALFGIHKEAASATSNWECLQGPYALTACSQVTGAANHVIGVNTEVYYPPLGQEAFLYVAFSAAGLPGQAKCSRGPYFWYVGAGGGVTFSPFRWTIPVNQYCSTGYAYVDWELAIRSGSAEIRVVWSGTSRFNISPYT